MKICFFCKISDRSKLFLIEFYHQDIKILKGIDPYLTIATKYSEIDWKADVIFVWWWTYAFYPVFVSKLLAKKLIITGTFNYKCPLAASDYFRRPLWQRVLIKYSIKHADKNILVSKNEYEQIRADWKLNNLVYSPHCIDTAKYSRGIYVGRKNELFTICWTGKENVKRKCLYEIIDSVALLKDKLDVHLNIAGHKGDAFEEVKEYIRERDLSAYVDILGEISEEEKLEYLQKCKFYLQPSRYEGFGLAIAEAMSCGAVVITTDVGEVKNVVGDAGIMINDVSPITIANAIEEYWDKDLESISISAHDRIQTLFSMDRREKDIMNVINEYGRL